MHGVRFDTRFSLELKRRHAEDKLVSLLVSKSLLLIFLQLTFHCSGRSCYALHRMLAAQALHLHGLLPLLPHAFCYVD